MPSICSPLSFLFQEAKSLPMQQCNQFWCQDFLTENCLLAKWITFTFNKTVATWARTEIKDHIPIQISCFQFLPTPRRTTSEGFQVARKDHQRDSSLSNCSLLGIVLMFFRLLLDHGELCSKTVQLCYAPMVLTMHYANHIIPVYNIIHDQRVSCG